MLQIVNPSSAKRYIAFGTAHNCTPGHSACDIQRLQSVLNTAVRLVAGSSRRDHAFSLLRDRHWLPVKQRVE